MKLLGGFEHRDGKVIVYDIDLIKELTDIQVQAAIKIEEVKQHETTSAQPVPTG